MCIVLRAGCGLTDVNSQQTRRDAVLARVPASALYRCAMYYAGTRLASRAAKNDAHGVPSGTQ